MGSAPKNKNLIKTESGNLVRSYAEAVIDNWLFDGAWCYTYEPKIEIAGVVYTPDWVLMPQRGIDKPVVIEYWGLLRKGGAKWVQKRLPKYLSKKEEKESAYMESENYYFVGIVPQDLPELETIFREKLAELVPHEES